MKQVMVAFLIGGCLLGACAQQETTNTGYYNDGLLQMPPAPELGERADSTSEENSNELDLSHLPEHLYLETLAVWQYMPAKVPDYSKEGTDLFMYKGEPGSYVRLTLDVMPSSMIPSIQSYIEKEHRDRKSLNQVMSPVYTSSTGNVGAFMYINDDLAEEEYVYLIAARVQGNPDLTVTCFATWYKSQDKFMRGEIHTILQTLRVNLPE